MTQVCVVMGEEECCLTARGHARGSPAGCAYISGIIYALGGYLTNQALAGRAEVTGLELEPGEAFLSARGGAEVGAAYEMALIGLLQLEKKYPELIRVSQRRSALRKNSRSGG